ncbi:MAG: hypothetical protein K6C34_05135 [Alphaproteobacteria bacterium]|nr:hypothetical protein [Alphaproteobacteria bacterium]
MHLIETLDTEFSQNLLAEILHLSVDERFITVDTEFIRENLETPLLCSLQLATQNEIYIFDCASADITFLNPIFENEDIKKVFHSVRQDIEILSAAGINIRNFYDTQLYEMILSTTSDISYQAIVQKYIGKRLKKNYSMSDWSKRPLSKRQLKYAAEDVLYLREVYKQQSQKLKELQRDNWLDDELKQLADDSSEMLLFGSVGKNNTSILKELLKWRAEKAAQLSVHPRDIAGDNVLKAICKRGKTFIRMMRHSRHAKKQMLDFLEFAESIADKIEIEDFSARNNIVVDVLKTVLDVCSQKENVVSHIIATTSELEKIANGEYDVKCLFGWRRKIFGDIALRILKGEIAIRVNNNCVEFK